MACNCCNNCCHHCCHHCPSRPTTPSCATLAKDVTKLINKINTKGDELEDAFDALEDTGCIKSANTGCNGCGCNHCGCNNCGCNRNSDFHYGICR